MTTISRLVFKAAACIFLLTVLPVQAQIPRIGDKPDMNGIWQTINSANWNLEAHPASKLDDFWQLGSLASIPAGQSVVEGGTIPYLPEALERREELRAEWPDSDPETYCYLPGIPRATYLPYPFQILQGTGDMQMVYSYANANRVIYVESYFEPPVDTWMGKSRGYWEGDTLVVETEGQNGRAQLDRSGNHYSYAMRVTERFTMENANVIRYEATMEDPNTFSRPWTISMPLYKRVEENVRLLEHNCVPFTEEKLYKYLEEDAD